MSVSDKNKANQQFRDIFQLKKLKDEKFAADILPLRLNCFAIKGRTSSIPTKFCKKGINESNSQSDLSSNQLSMGIPLSIWKPNAYEEKNN